MNRISFAVILLLVSCTTFEEKIYTPPTKVKTVVILPFLEEEFEEKSFQEKKTSPNFYLGFGIAYNIHQLVNQSQEIFSISLLDISREFSLETQFKKESEILEILKSQKLADYLVRGNFQMTKKNNLKITTKIYNLESSEFQKVKSKEISFLETADKDLVEYSKYLKNGLYPEILKFMLCYNVMRESCEPIQKEKVDSLTLEETTELSEFLDHYRGFYHYLEAVHNSKLSENLKESQLAEFYFKKAIFKSEEKGKTYKNAIQSLLLLTQNLEKELQELNLKLSCFQVFYSPKKDLLQPILEKEEANNLRNIINQAVRFVQENPEYRLYITSAWSNEFDNPEYRSSNLRSTNFIEYLYGKQNLSPEKLPYVLQDTLGEEDTTTLKIQKMSGGN